MTAKNQQTQLLSTSRPFTSNPVRDVKVLLPAKARLSITRAKDQHCTLSQRLPSLSNCV